MTANQEKDRLDSIAKTSLYATLTGVLTIKYSYTIFKRYLADVVDVLEIGPAEGIMTELLVSDGFKVTCVEGSEFFCKALKERFPDLEVHNVLLENFNPAKKYGAIILGHVLEHVDDPVKILKMARNWIHPKSGKILAAVPNAKSLHRQAAVAMGLILSEYTMSEKDVHHGHRRIYDHESFARDFINAGFKIEKMGGYWIKPLPDKQLEEQWSNGQLEAYLQLGERYPEIAAEIYVVARSDS